MKGLGKVLLIGLAFMSIHFLVVDSVFAQAKKGKTPAKKTTAAEKAVIANLPKVTQIDINALRDLLKREGDNAKPLLINFWATWCDPCREEFPDLIKIDSDYKGKIDFITISLDELSELNRDVPKFLGQMKALMPAYLLKTPDEEAAISLVAKDWQGGLPFTILLNTKGETVFTKQGKVKPDVLRTELDKFSAGTNTAQIIEPQIYNLPVNFSAPYNSEKGKVDAQKDISAGKLIIKRYGLTMAMLPQNLKKLKEKYGIEVTEQGCIIPGGFVQYAEAYNETTRAEIKRKFGVKALELLAIK